MRDEDRHVFRDTLAAMAAFKRTFSRDLKPEFVAELYVVDLLDLELATKVNQRGYDALGPAGERYQIKHRGANTLNVDLNNFDFDYTVLVNFDDDYQLIGIYRMHRDEARKVFHWRGPKHDKYQATQAVFKSHSERIA